MAGIISVSSKKLEGRRKRLRKRRQLKIIQATWRTIAISSLASGLLWLAVQPIWVVTDSHDVVISGNQLLSDEAVQSLLVLSYPQSLLRIQPSRLAESLKNQPMIEQAYVSRRLFPPGLIVQIKERVPVAIALDKRSRSLVGSDANPSSSSVPSGAKPLLPTRTTEEQAGVDDSSASDGKTPKNKSSQTLALASAGESSAATKLVNPPSSNKEHPNETSSQTSLLTETSKEQKNSDTHKKTGVVGLIDSSGVWMPLEKFTLLHSSVRLPDLKVIGLPEQYRPYWSELYQALSQSSVKVMEIDWQDPTNLILKTELGTVHLGTPSFHLSEKIRVMAQMRHLPVQLNLSQIEYIDLKNPEYPLVQMNQKKQSSPQPR
ncbi:FtsQ-type POTRA domain-containing protein [Aetokthonos hydrillicola Thurmond2011]|jgi:cell division protein FtsQ|uniref:FtsQ-type POTRA domain-containing protein n=1 Tax=Aetokthonos hydrillicola Thurmond2011 TaxID=2712845 RepID=A0AAP5I9Q3_9CYAN|nr:FtsQ-type POTRA domain-containing protein [Aetokthonos hydrillicola]MBO3460803.1 FtsQ-type POTRA domain-containing protein [Aetokthonos hydrillicola CCALA 1050]MBW4588266.1 FtsQ-type POTRA domain-containing protein [Aetokthonos hydrillicola CCALA 1050]MDR9897254.1 FtsQ-type POTRA domain-containing protein [Aetokthonos hydrillicola Thurmond2011]